MKIKRHFIIMYMALSCLMVLPTLAQENQPQKGQNITISGGALLETNISGFHHSGVDDGQSRMKIGGSVGGFLNLGITRAFSVQGEMLMHYKHSRFEWDGIPGNYDYWGVEIPIYAMLHIHLKKDRQLYIGIGPYTEFGFDATYKRNGIKGDLYEKVINRELPILRDSNTGFALKIGYEFTSGLQLNVTYKASITNLLDANSNTVKMYPLAASIGIAYRFGK